MSSFLRKYATVTTVYFPLIGAGTVNFTSTASLTTADMQISIDGGAFATVGTAIVNVGSFGYSYACTTADLTGKYITMVIHHTAGSQAFEDSMLLIETYGNSAAAHTFDFSIANQTVIASAGTVTLTGGQLVTVGTISAAAVGAGLLSAGAFAASFLSAGGIATAAITSAKIATGGLDPTNFAAGFISAGGIATGAITSAKIVAGGLDPTNFAAGFLSAGGIATGAITSTKFASGAIDSASIAVGAFTTYAFVAGFLSAGGVAAGALSAGAVAANFLSAGGIATAAITSAKIATGGLDPTNFAAGFLSAGGVAASAISSGAFAADAIDSNALAASAVTEIWAVPSIQPTGVPSITASVFSALCWMYALSHNRIEQTSTVQTLKQTDGTTTIAAATVSDDATTFVRGSFN